MELNVVHYRQRMNPAASLWSLPRIIQPGHPPLGAVSVPKRFFGAVQAVMQTVDFLLRQLYPLFG